MRVRMFIALALFLAAVSTGCSTAPTTYEDRDALHAKVQAAIATLKATDPAHAKLFDTAAGYAVFPDVGKGGVVVGAAYGKGELYEKGALSGYCAITEGTLGLQLGGQSYAEVIFFENDLILTDFKAERFAFAANASAVAVKKGETTNAKYDKGVLVFTFDEKGLMAAAVLGGQKFKFQPR